MNPYSSNPGSQNRVCNKKHLSPVVLSCYCMMILLLGIFLSIKSHATEDTALHSDLSTALALQGIDCDQIKNLEKLDKDAYEVTCETGQVFSLSAAASGALQIVHTLTGTVIKGVGFMLGEVPLISHILPDDKNSSKHDLEVARSLFSIVELSGNDCEAVLDVEETGTNEYVVHCANNISYHVFNNQEGRVRVELLPAGKQSTNS